jgi:phospholipid/cholesterol/gamma-HCH transport system ATP-binding protein
VIEIRSVYKNFATQSILRGLTLTIPTGTTLAIVGPSGVGKSVLLKLILGILSPDSGEIILSGLNMTECRSEVERNFIRTKLGVLFQSAALLDSLSIYDNVAFPLVHQRGSKLTKKSVKERVFAILESLSLLPFVNMLPQQLSLGTRKRVGLARALVNEPEILLIDEPNTGLDPLVGQEVYDLLRESSQRWKFTGLIISHEIPEVYQVSDQVAVLLNGTILEVGSPNLIQSSTHPAIQQFLNGKKDGPIKLQ